MSGLPGRGCVFRVLWLPWAWILTPACSQFPSLDRRGRCGGVVWPAVEDPGAVCRVTVCDPPWWVLSPVWCPHPPFWLAARRRSRPPSGGVDVDHDCRLLGGLSSRLCGGA